MIFAVRHQFHSIKMNKFVFRASLLVLVALFVSDSACFKLFKSSEAMDLLASSLEKKSTKRDIWYFMGITREQFKRDYENLLTEDVRQSIYQEMRQWMVYFKKYLQGRTTEWQAESTKNINEKRSEGIGEVTKIDYSRLTSTLDVMGKADEFVQPPHVQKCLAAINQDDPKNEKKIVFASCGELIFSKVLEKIDNMVMDSLDSFIDIFEEVTSGLASFVQLLHDYTKETGEKYMKRNFELEDTIMSQPSV